MKMPTLSMEWDCKMTEQQQKPAGFFSLITAPLRVVKLALKAAFYLFLLVPILLFIVLPMFKG